MFFCFNNAEGCGCHCSDISCSAGQFMLYCAGAGNSWVMDKEWCSLSFKIQNLITKQWAISSKSQDIETGAADRTCWR